MRKIPETDSEGVRREKARGLGKASGKKMREERLALTFPTGGGKGRVCKTR